MEIVINASNTELSSRARLAIKSRIEIVVSKLAQYVNAVIVTFDGLRNSPDPDTKQCKVRLSLVSMESVVVSAIEDNAQTAFTIAFAKSLAVLKTRVTAVQRILHKDLGGGQADAQKNDEGVERFTRKAF